MKYLLGSIFVVSSLALEAQLDVRDGLVMQYLLDETGGNTAHDSVGNRHMQYESLNGGTGPEWSGPGATLKRANNENFAVSFNHIGFPNFFPPDLDQNFSFSAWIKGTPHDGQTQVFGGIISFGDLQFATYDRRIELVVNELGAYSHEGGVGSGSFSTGQILSPTEWQHIAVTNDGAHTRFYLNAVQVHEVAHFIRPNRLTDLLSALALREQNTATDYIRHSFNGTLRDVRVYNRALQSAEMAAVMAGAREVEDTTAGLWVGEVVFDEVKEAKTEEWGKAGAPFAQRILMWSDGSGRMELLQEAMVVRTRDTEPIEVILTDETQVSNYDGVVRRGDKLVGNRFSATAMPFAGENSALVATGTGDEVQATLTLPGSHPRNPFRHKYHPDLGNGLSITRAITIDWTDDEEPSAGSLTGVVSEAVTGLHKDVLETRGTVTFTRVSLSTTLNP